MGTKALKTLNFGLLGVLLAALTCPLNASAAKLPQVQKQTFQATENDGTAQEIHGGTQADDTDGGPMTPAVTETQAPAAAPAPVAKAPAPKIEAPAAAPAATMAASADLSDLKRQNTELMHRLDMLEKARAEQAAANQPVAAPAAPSAAPAVAPVAVAPIAAAPVAAAPALTAAPQAKTAAPAALDPLESRMREKTLVTQQSRDETMRQDNLAAKKKALREAAAKFDAVPDQYIPELSERLKYANDILKRWGRAYDYRVTTLGDFKKILAELESADEKKILAN